MATAFPYPEREPEQEPEWRPEAEPAPEGVAPPEPAAPGVLIPPGVDMGTEPEPRPGGEGAPEVLIPKGVEMEQETPPAGERGEAPEVLVPPSASIGTEGQRPAGARQMNSSAESRPERSANQGAAQPLSPSDERTWAMLAHLSVLLNLVTGFLGPVAALLIYLVYKDRSRYVAYQSMQAFVFQLIWWVGGGVLAAAAWAISGTLAVILIGCLLMPIALFFTLLPLAALVYGVIGAIQTSQGLDFRYWLIGDWVRGELHR